MSPTIEEPPIRTGKWAPVITVRADTVCPRVYQKDAQGYETVSHIFKRGQTVVATIESVDIAAWWIHEDTPE